MTTEETVIATKLDELRMKLAEKKRRQRLCLAL